MPLVTVWNTRTGERTLRDVASLQRERDIQIALLVREELAKLSKPPPGTDYAFHADEIPSRARAMDRRDRDAAAWAEARTRRLRYQEQTVANRIAQLWSDYNLALKDFAFYYTDDHDYISAMFSLYAQGRSRLLQ